MKIDWQNFSGKLGLISGRYVYFFIGDLFPISQKVKNEIFSGECPDGMVKVMFSGDGAFVAVDRKEFTQSMSFQEFYSLVKACNGQVWILAEDVIEY